MVISIHQPNFMPWYPFFQKIKSADKFVILTHCQFEKNGYQNRFNFNSNWYTMSVKKGLDPIKDKIYLNPKNDWDKIKNRLPEYKSILDEFDECIFESLEKTNILIINRLCEMLNIKTEIVTDYPTKLKSTHRLIDICNKYEATEYISGIGAKDYLNEILFDQNGIKISYQEKMKFKHTLEVL
tara:strand:- start:709 stop:1257 length:549 start_codon:yes stop_codon:yes gene_type:complete